MSIGPFLERMDIFDEPFGFNLNRVVDFLNSFTDYSGVLSLQFTNGHLAITGTAPTLGALQSGIASQSIVGNDSFHAILVTTTASPPAAGATLAIVQYASTWLATPTIVVTPNGPGVVWATVNNSLPSGYHLAHGGTSAGVAGLSANTTYRFGVIAVGVGSA